MTLSSPTATIGVCLSAIPTVETTTDIPVAVIDKAVAASYAEDDFVPWGVAGAQIHNAEKIVFSTDANGDTVVSVRLFPFARSNVAAGQIVLLDNAGQWTPYGAPAAGNNYVVWNNSLRTGGNDWQTYAVPGEQWVMYRVGLRPMSRRRSTTRRMRGSTASSTIGTGRTDLRSSMRRSSGAS